MDRPAAFAASTLSGPHRRVILAIAFLIGLGVAFAPRTPSVHAQETKPAPATAAKSAAKTVTISDGRGGEGKVTVEVNADAAAEAADTDASAGPRKGHNIQIGKHGRVKVNGFGADREFDSFDQFVHDEPTIAGMVIAIVSVVFLSPVLAIGLILWYRMRKARMLNETMLKLAERGVIPSAEALNALAGGRPAAALATGATTAPLYEQARQIRRREVWSDLRKGVIMGGIGLGLTFFSMLDDRSANSVGLVLLFVGIGYVVLWWFEERQLAPAAGLQSGSNASVNAPGGSPPSA